MHAQPQMKQHKNYIITISCSFIKLIVSCKGQCVVVGFGFVHDALI